MELDLLKSSNRDEFIKNNLNFIYKICNQICKRNLSTENDDEFSIAMIAFNKACDSYNNNKGNFYSYAAVLIKNALIDFFRESSNTPNLVFNNEDTSFDYIDYKTSMNEFNLQVENLMRAEEIKMLTDELNTYKISFLDLVKYSPKHIDTRDKLLNIAFKCSSDTYITQSLKQKKRLPVKEVCILTGSNRKLVETWRKYILALILILSTKDYPYIKSFLNIEKAGENYD